MSEEEKAIKRLEEMTKNYSLNSEDLHYAIILYCLIVNLQQENKQLKEHIEKYEHYCKTTGIEELMKENQKYKEVIDKAIKLIEDSYYSKNTTDIDSIVVSGDKLLQVRKILKEVE